MSCRYEGEKTLSTALAKGSQGSNPKRKHWIAISYREVLHTSVHIFIRHSKPGEHKQKQFVVTPSVTYKINSRI